MRTATPPPETTPTWAAGVRRRLPFYLIAASLIGLLAGFLTYVYLDRLQAASLPTSPALTAREDIRPGTVLTETMLELQRVPLAILPEGHLTRLDQAVGRVAIVPIAAREIVLPGKLGGGEAGGLSGLLPDGRWALVLPAGWLAAPLPMTGTGDRYEIMACQRGQSADTAGVIVSAVEVLALGGTAESPDSLTLAVTLEQAEAILYAHSNGFDLLMLLRPQGG